MTTDHEHIAAIRRELAARDEATGSSLAHATDDEIRAMIAASHSSDPIRLMASIVAEEQPAIDGDQ